MISVQQFTDLRLGKLKAAVADWEEMIRKLRSLANGEGGGASAAKLKSRAQVADWKGENATVGKDFVTKTASEFDDAVTEAESVYAVLRDAYAAFTKHKGDLEAAITDLSKGNIHIDADGKARQSISAEANEQTYKPTEGELDEAEKRIKRILWDAHEDDRVAARALHAFSKNKYDFSDHDVKSLKDADRQQGKADAEAWAKKIAKGNVANWSDAELARFNEVLKNQRDNSAFTVTLATMLKAKGTLSFWHDLAVTPTAVSGDKAVLLSQIQDNLSMSLANATHSNKSEMETWKKDVISFGSQRFSPMSDPQGLYGFQLMSSLMRKGKYDAVFLQDYGKSMVNFERNSGTHPDSLWASVVNLEFPPNGKPNDPVSSFMEALGHNPKASIEFFDGSSGKGKNLVTNFDYLVGHGDGARDWPNDADGKPYGYASLGHALESATTGVPLGSDKATEPHSDKSAKLFHDIVEEFGHNSKRLEGTGLTGSLGRITAEYMRDVPERLLSRRRD